MWVSKIGISISAVFLFSFLTTGSVAKSEFDVNLNIVIDPQAREKQVKLLREEIMKK